MNSTYKEQLNKTFADRLRSRPAGDYNTVSVLVIAWEKCDLNGIDDEVDEVVSSFA